MSVADSARLGAPVNAKPVKDEPVKTAQPVKNCFNINLRARDYLHSQLYFGYKPSSTVILLVAPAAMTA
jgi:hypothetical protein